MLHTQPYWISVATPSSSKKVHPDFDVTIASRKFNARLQVVSCLLTNCYVIVWSARRDVQQSVFLGSRMSSWSLPDPRLLGPMCGSARFQRCECKPLFSNIFEPMWCYFLESHCASLAYVRATCTFCVCSLPRSLRFKSSKGHSFDKCSKHVVHGYPGYPSQLGQSIGVPVAL